MPSSDWKQIGDVVDVIAQINPRTILEIGIGFGKWGILCREYFEINRGNYAKKDWQIKMEGIEIFEPYRCPNWDYAYDCVHLGNAVKIIDGLGHYDLVICCDVIEHFEKDAGKAFLEKMLNHGRYVIITSPRMKYPQGALFGNDSECHLSQWTRQDFKKIPHLYKDISISFLALLSKDPANLRDLRLPTIVEALGVKRSLLELTGLILARFRSKLRQNGSRHT